jgi:alpha-1,6-rhamnosyltransferase
VSAALNHGLKYARGEYVCTPDLDDIMLPSSVRLRAEYLNQHPEVGCVGALIIYMDSDGNDTKTQKLAGIKKLTFDEILGDAVVVGAPVSLYRMDALDPIIGAPAFAHGHLHETPRTAQDPQNQKASAQPG